MPFAIPARSGCLNLEVGQRYTYTAVNGAIPYSWTLANANGRFVGSTTGISVVYEPTVSNVTQTLRVSTGNGERSMTLRHR